MIIQLAKKIIKKNEFIKMKIFLSIKKLEQKQKKFKRLILQKDQKLCIAKSVMKKKSIKSWSRFRG